MKDNKRTGKKNLPREPLFRNATGVTEKHVKLARTLALRGFKEPDFLEAFGVSHQTWVLWKKNSPELRQAVYEGSLIAFSPVMKAMEKLAAGKIKVASTTVISKSEDGTKTIQHVRDIPPSENAAFGLWRLQHPEFAFKSGNIVVDTAESDRDAMEKYGEYERRLAADQAAQEEAAQEDKS